MARWRLHPLLGGGELNDAGDTTVGAVGFLIDAAMTYLPRAVLTEIPPPTPDQPPPGAYLIGDEGILCYIYKPGAKVMCLMPAGRSSGWIDWDEAWKRHGGPDAAITRLVPDPFAEPVQLPWLGTSIDKTPLDIDVAGRGRDVCVRLSMGDRDVEIAPDMAHDMTRALWAAADAAEKGTT